MFRSLASNIAISGVAYFFISIVGLLLTPLLIGAYGLAGYGQILLARIFLPSAAFGFLDLGVGENVTRIIASIRSQDESHRAGQTIAFLTVLAVTVAGAIGVGLGLFAPQIAELLSIPDAQRPGFITLLRVTAVLEPLMFAALIAEGILKGREEFRRLRKIEVISSLSYAGLTVLAVLRELGPNAIGYTMLAGQVLRAALAIAAARKIFSKLGIRFDRWSREQRRDILGWSMTMFYNKALGTLQTQIGSPLLGVLAGPAAVGLYDAIVRLPRFIKTLFSLLSGTVLPAAARLHAGAQDKNTRKLALVGIIGGFALCAPLAAMTAAYAQPILTYWLGSAVADHWPWMALMMVVPLANMPKSFGGSMIMTSRETMARMNRLFVVQVLAQLALALGLLDALDLWSFVVAEVATVVIMLPIQLGIISDRLKLGRSLAAPMIATMALAGAVSAAARWLTPFPNPVALGAIVALGTGLVWSAAPFVLLDTETRRTLVPRAKLAIAQVSPFGKRR